VSFQRQARTKKSLTSLLEEIPGVGPKRRRTLLRHFGDLEAIRRAPVEEIARLPGMNQAVARKIKEFL
jgi:excinuclease ABC subunit C